MSTYAGVRGRGVWLPARALALVCGIILFAASWPVRSSSLADANAGAFALGRPPVPHGALGALRTLNAPAPQAKAPACQPSRTSLAMLTTIRPAVAVAGLASTDQVERIFYDGFTGPGTCIDTPDCPSSLSECFSTSCVAGQCEQPPAATGTACSSGVCNATGACVACNFSADCAPTGLECAPAFCVANVCTQAPLPTETPCSMGVCDGTGACVGCLVNTDCPPTGSQCMLAACVTQVCTQQPALFGTICDTGICNGVGICITPP